MNKIVVIDLINKLYPGLLDDTDWLPNLVQVASDPSSNILGKKMGDILELFSQAIENRQKHLAANLLGLALAIDPTKARDKIGTLGVLRASKYGFKTDVLKNVVRTLLRLHNLTMPTDVRTYLQSVFDLLKLGGAVARLHKGLTDFLIRHRLSGLKSAVAVADCLFMTDHPADPSLPMETLDAYTKEDIVEAASYVIHCYDKAIGIDDSHYANFPEDAVSHGLWSKILIKACKIRKYCDVEILVDAFGFICRQDTKETVSISPPFPELEKSIRLGYIQAEQARQPAVIERVQAIADGGASIIGIADDIYARFFSRIVKLREFPIRRYTYEMPDLPPIRALFHQNGMTAEEVCYLKQILNIERVTWETLRDFEFSDGLSFLDLVKVHRVLTFVARIASNHLKSVLIEDPGLAYQSMVPVFEKSTLQHLFELAVPADKAIKALELLTWRSGQTGVVDLQYKPIIDGGRYYLVPINIAGNSNWYRNIAYTEKRRVIDAVDQEGCAIDLATSLGRRSDMVRTEYETTLRKIHFEADVIARLGDILFVFECKHSFLPCNPFELRTSYKHVQTAASQLTVISTLLSDQTNERELYRRLAWEVGPARLVVTCIVSCNGMFPGLRVQDHPVRRLVELLNMIDTGQVAIGTVSLVGENGKDGVAVTSMVKRTLWPESKFSPEFLAEYIAEDGLTSDLFASMIGVTHSYNIDGTRLLIDSYALDFEEATTRLAARSGDYHHADDSSS